MAREERNNRATVRDEAYSVRMEISSVQEIAVARESSESLSSWGVRQTTDGYERRRRGMHMGCWWETHKEGDHSEDQDVGGWTILKWILG
jgi:hypothetical protein